MKLNSLRDLSWEVEAAHIVPHSEKGKDDILNGLSLCHLHHWAFDAGWFAVGDNFTIQVSSKVKSLHTDFGRMENMISSECFSIKIIKCCSPKEKKFILIRKQSVGIVKINFII